METSPKTVETISRLARWNVGRLDSLDPWQIIGPRLVYQSSSFKMGNWNWILILEKNRNNQCQCLWLAKSPLSLPRNDFVARLVLRVFDRTDPTRRPFISPVLDAAFKGFYKFAWPMDSTSPGPFIIDIEFLDLKLCQGSSMCLNEGMIQALATKNTLPCMSLMLGDRLHADVTINTSNGVLTAHKSVLCASSPVFRSMFSHDLREKESSTIDIPDMSVESCTALLGYMYGTIKEEEFYEQRLLLCVIADKYGMTDLKDYCEESLSEDLCSSNILERLHVAWFYQLDKLKNQCFMYLFDFGKICDVKDEIMSFYSYADNELKLEMFKHMVTVWKHG